MTGPFTRAPTAPSMLQTYDAGSLIARRVLDEPWADLPEVIGRHVLEFVGVDADMVVLLGQLTLVADDLVSPAAVKLFAEASYSPARSELAQAFLDGMLSMTARGATLA